MIRAKRDEQNKTEAVGPDKRSKKEGRKELVRAANNSWEAGHGWCLNVVPLQPSTASVSPGPAWFCLTGSGPCWPGPNTDWNHNSRHTSCYVLLHPLPLLLIQLNVIKIN